MDLNIVKPAKVRYMCHSTLSFKLYSCNIFLNMFNNLSIIASGAERSFFPQSSRNQNNATSQKLLIFSLLLIERKMVLLDHIMVIRDELARLGPPNPAATLFDG